MTVVLMRCESGYGGNSYYNNTTAQYEWLQKFHENKNNESN